MGWSYGLVEPMASYAITWTTEVCVTSDTMFGRVASYTPLPLCGIVPPVIHEPFPALYRYRTPPVFLSALPTVIWECTSLA